ncbi:hypothetical protein A3B21_00150 [Candidatus Uhrbacteria bacterium RIFCSPLOWO2_01_FULL_47_24]|uniref:Methyltransferase domain-containing protein n=1 Tax=Candidatus Uhrbacteria bacterium RIFCSPLOWO2_01_FULL_47_24 TaxID=1802401 RepID=A0A1F7USQ2_9BACT|nr:MAG: hypothetical protein A2753_02250 [Candidatus Uhrbacteria bacterium RIFCSPHIGHO2_01_FULL_47_11]OGL68008.1 MAG: hypothetical protein A3D58_01525 [Candidatus Uhrbacteria bacterium RIFCSPHIGHO2_02_FULL_46_47]OGL75420.1 MAG: hypothetical protein A3F52_04865 [Candidatus Uhrbacteria bacterium RIFCSPHIGHO2_12_FULL_47_11]OGL81322.1 MAG: hypothetical protein A3B21_00150 [Candidatus Uhrbacteria bacterium RIFCSPLOWO2_01_FULL_47_24]OGL83934.1 MAG: hypothetical protein A3J03_00755 [Candidatus Uhrbact
MVYSDSKTNKIAASANAIAYSSDHNKNYIEGAPHVKHSSLLDMYMRLAKDCYNEALRYSSPPKVLDLGAGDGSATIPFLEMGAEVTAVDIAEDQLKLLQRKSSPYGNKLHVRCGDALEVMKSMQHTQQHFNIITANSFLHHIPDYLGFIRFAANILGPHGQFLSFQDPLRYDSLGKLTYAFSTGTYFCWRILQGDILAGMKRRLRRNKGFYLEDSIEDNVEYHVVRNGVDQDAIQTLFNGMGFNCRIIRYFSTQSSGWQRVGSVLGVKNSFGVIAKKV